MGERHSNAIEVVVGWLDAMRRGDLESVAECFDPQVIWSGVPDDAICRNRDEVIDMLRTALTPCPDDPRTYAPEDGLRGAVAVELIAAPEAAVLGAKVPGLSEVGEVGLRGQLFNVFHVRDGRIVEVADYALRDDALRAAGATAPEWF
jgi:limonene-1,2-epoxide hydrolase